MFQISNFTMTIRMQSIKLCILFGNLRASGIKNRKKRVKKLILKKQKQQNSHLYCN